MDSERFYWNCFHTINWRGIHLPSVTPDRHFTSLNHSIKEREGKLLKFAKYTNCGRVTPYRLNSLKGKRLECKGCKKPISLTLKSN